MTKTHETFDELKARIDYIKRHKRKSLPTLSLRGIYKLMRIRDGYSGAICGLRINMLSKIVRSINALLLEDLFNGKSIRFPYRMGRLVLERIKYTSTIENGRVVSHRPMDWKSTMQLWEEDSEAFAKKTVIHCTCNYRNKISYQRTGYHIRNAKALKFKLLRTIIVDNAEEYGLE